MTIPVCYRSWIILLLYRQNVGAEFTAPKQITLKTQRKRQKGFTTVKTQCDKYIQSKMLSIIVKIY